MILPIYIVGDKKIILTSAGPYYVIGVIYSLQQFYQQDIIIPIYIVETEESRR